ncbi:MAG: outer membrane protein assembly factor BamD [Bacteroidales bacterium]|nr:outer membrane protein assembly factor BamD [Bacteroidales bacterium]
MDMKEKCTYKLSFLLAMAASLAFPSCTEYTKLTKSDDIDLKYEKAFEYYDKGEYYKAATLLESVIPSYRGTEKGETGLYTKAMAHFNNKEYLTAKSYFSAYCKGYPSGKYIEDAKFHIGYCYYLDSPNVKLDQENTQKAIDELLEFSQTYPHSEKLPRVLDLLKEMREKLAEKEYLNAKLYYDLGDYMGNNYLSAIVTAGNALKKYPDTQYKEELSFLILESKYMQAVKSVESKMEDRFRDTVDEYYNFVKEFPESEHRKDAEKFYSRAKKYLQSIEG